MTNLDRMKDVIESEISNIASKGLSTSNIENAYKLIDMMKDICEMDYYEACMYEGGSSSTPPRMREASYRSGRRGSYSDGYSGGRRYSMDGESYSSYMDSKQSYRSDKTDGNRQRMMENLEATMQEFTEKIEDMARDAEMPEERQTIMRYVNQLRKIM